MNVTVFLKKRGENCGLVPHFINTDCVRWGMDENFDINFETFPIICNKIIEGDYFRSETIINSQRELFKRNINWDVYDSQILLLIADGVKTINIPEYVPLSMSSIEKRKANIKAQLINGVGNDKELIHSAKKLGLI